MDPCFGIKQAIELKLDGELFRQYKQNPYFVRDKFAEKVERRFKKFNFRKNYRSKQFTFKVLKAWRK